MLRILGSHRQGSRHLTRRDLLQVGASTLLGLGLADLTTQDAAAAAPLVPTSAFGQRRQFGKAKNVILLYLYGAMSQIDTLDPKPDGPMEIRGPFGSIATALPGVRLGEHLPGIAQRLDRITVVRSMTHPVPIHNVANAVSGIARTDVAMELNAHDPRHWPFFGSVLQYLEDEEAASRGKRRPSLIPANVILPWRQSAHAPENRAGMYGGFLGARYDPAVIEFPDKGISTKTLVEKNPYGGIDRASKFRFPSTTLPAEVTLDRFNRRRSLLSQLDDRRRWLASGSPAVGDMESFQKMALTLCDSTQIPAALDLDREPARLREQYGYHLFGQSALMARRLIESGARVATVFWDEYLQNNSGWDTHNNQTRRLRDVLCPGLDQTVSALLDDLEDRGMLDETLVLVLTEHGRTPKAEGGGDGRNHWSSVYSIAMAGAGVARGRVVGASDAQGGIVKDRPVSPNDILRTIYHLLGVDADRTIPGIQNRPTPLVDGGRMVREILA